MTHNQFEFHQASARGLARILLIDGDDASRITLKAVLEAGGYLVSTATTTVEALEKLDTQSFELVLCNRNSGGGEIDTAVLSYARFQDYEPATALLSTVQCTSDLDMGISWPSILVEPQNVPDLLGQIADLIGDRAMNMLEREFETGGPVH